MQSARDWVSGVSAVNFEVLSDQALIGEKFCPTILEVLAGYLSKVLGLYLLKDFMC